MEDGTGLQEKVDGKSVRTETALDVLVRRLSVGAASSLGVFLALKAFNSGERECPVSFPFHRSLVASFLRPVSRS